jgi:hypothetical protein
MIPVILQAEPAQFGNRVRRPGRAFLRRNPPPTTIQIRAKNYWRRCHDDLYSLYNGICAYSAQWTPRTKNPANIEHSSVDHYVPLSANHALAYEWNNYRLARARLNNNKASEHVMDPFGIQPDWFVINFRTFLIRPNDGLSLALENDIEATITQLDLNHDDFVQERVGILQAYADDPPTGISFDFLESHYPFIAYELRRQGDVESIRTRMRRP